ncbi:MAG: peptidylprolyl isomerase [Gemmatimonadetes bacterium]|nr:peptidylprolyl isomerase [Gemmatimonadota bacterium]
MSEDAILVQVNGIAVPLRHIVRQMGVADNLLFFDGFARRELIRQLARREGVCAAQEDIQRRVDDWRYQHRLERVEDTEAYLAKRGITLQDVTEDAEVRRLEYLLSEKIAEGQVESYFAQHTLAFDEAEICWIFHTDKDVIDEVDLQIRDEGADFYAMARRFSQDAHTRSGSGFLGRVRRKQLPKGIAARVFAASTGEVLRPEKVSKGFALYLLQERYPATLNKRTKKEIRKYLFNQWLQREMQRADIRYPIWQGKLQK